VKIVDGIPPEPHAIEVKTFDRVGREAGMDRDPG
jgi:hypothetical protein